MRHPPRSILSKLLPEERDKIRRLPCWSCLRGSFGGFPRSGCRCLDVAQLLLQPLPATRGFPSPTAFETRWTSLSCSPGFPTKARYPLVNRCTLSALVLVLRNQLLVLLLLSECCPFVVSFLFSSAVCCGFFQGFCVSILCKTTEADSLYKKFILGVGMVA